MSYITVLGIMAGLLTMSSSFPQLLKTWKTKEVDDLSFHMYAILSIGLLLWIVYGYIIWNVPILFANIIGLTINGPMLYLIIKYK